MLVKITAHDLKGNLIIDDSLYETIAIPRIGEYIMAYANKEDDYYYLKVILVVHKGIRRNSKDDFYDRDIQVFCTESKDVFKGYK